MSKLKVHSSRTVFAIENEHGEDTGGAVVVTRSRRSVKVKPEKAERMNGSRSREQYADPYTSSAWSEESERPSKGKSEENYTEVTDNFQVVRVIGLPFKAQVFGENLSPEQAATEGVTEIRDRLRADLELLNSIL